MPFFSPRDLILQARKGRVMMKEPYKIDGPAYISFSGGRTSGYLLYHILEAFNWKLPKDILVLFANTGREFEETLKFVHDCETHWGVKIRWIEYRRDPKAPIFTPGTEHYSVPGIGCQSQTEVTYETASRNGEPFKIAIEVEADYKIAKGELPILPNVAQRWCSARLKAEAMDRFMVSLGYDYFNCAVGMRADEPSRVRKLKANANATKDFVCPMDDAVVTMDEVLEFWKHQDFDLELKHDPRLGTYQGNCDLCFLKKSKKLEKIINERPETLDWWVEQEKATGCTFSRGRVSYTDMKEQLDRKISLKVCNVNGRDDDEDADVCNCTD